MPRKSEKIPKIPIGRVMNEGGAIRVSSDAMDFMSDYLWTLGMKISKDAIAFSTHAKRRTITKDDIVLACKKYM